MNGAKSLKAHSQFPWKIWPLISSSQKHLLIFVYFYVSTVQFSLLSLKCKISAIWLVETACIFPIFLNCYSAKIRLNVKRKKVCQNIKNILYLFFTIKIYANLKHRINQHLIVKTKCIQCFNLYTPNHGIYDCENFTAQNNSECEHFLGSISQNLNLM